MEKAASAATGIRQRAGQQCIAPSCAAVFSLVERIYVCPRCQSPLEIQIDHTFDPARLRDTWRSRRTSPDPLDRSGVWRFRELLPFDSHAPIVTLLEGNTPIYEAPRCAEYCGLDALRLKHQGSNPTGSFKDTGMTVAVTHAKLLGARTAVCASTGNTAASLAAYSARADLQCAILLPRGQIAAAKLAQSMDYGAVICEIDGNFDDCMRLIQELGGDPAFYVANSINPFRIEGQKTVAFELMEQCAWRSPDHLVVPGGNLGNSSAFGKGLRELLLFGLIDRLPKLHVIQAEGAAPFVRMFAELQKSGSHGESDLPAVLVPEPHPRTLATAIKIGAPVSWKKSLRAVLESHGQVIAVTEQEIADAKAVIGRDGIGCEPASATTVAGIRRLVAAGHIQRGDSTIAVLTGHVLKDPDYVSHYHRGVLSLGADREHGPAWKIKGGFENRTEHVAASKASILEVLKRRI
jgi:threonine synthase